MTSDLNFTLRCRAEQLKNALVEAMALWTMTKQLWILLEADEGDIGNYWIGADKDRLKNAVTAWAEGHLEEGEFYLTKRDEILAILDKLVIGGPRFDYMRKPTLKTFQAKPGKYVLAEYVQGPSHYPSLELIILDLESS